MAADANPWCQPTWIKDTSQSNISIADMETPPLRTDEEGSFTILSAKESDSGWYRCVCDHELGVDGHSASYGYFLNVRCKFSLPFQRNNHNLRHDAFIASTARVCSNR